MPRDEVIYDQSLLEDLEDDNTLVGDAFDADADAYAPPPPLPDGDYLATLKCGGMRDPETGARVLYTKPKYKNDHVPHPTTSVTATILDPGGPQDGKWAEDPFVRTKLDDRKGASAVSSIYRAVTGKPILGTTEGQHMAALLKVLQENPQVRITTKLQGQYFATQEHKDKKEYTKVKGEKNFTDPNTGKLTGIAYGKDGEPIVDVNGDFVMGRPVITGYKRA